MLDALRRYTQAIGGIAELSRSRAEHVASTFARQGLISTDQVRSFAQELVRRSQENRQRLRDMVKRELPRLGVASRTEVDRLKQRVQALEASQRASAKRTATPARRAAPAKAAKRAAPAKKAATRAKRATPRRAPAKSRRTPARRRG